MKRRPVTRACRSVLVLMILAVPPWALLSIPTLPSFQEIALNSGMAQQSWQTVKRGGLPVPALLAVTIAVVWLSWLRICWGFFVAMGRMVLRRPVRHEYRWPARLALWALMVSPTVAVVAVPSTLAAESSPLETTKEDFRSDSFTSPPVLVSTLVACGVLLRLRARRRRLMRASRVEGIPEALAWEADINRNIDELAVVRLELAVRTLMSLQAKSFRIVLQDPSGRIFVEFPSDRMARPPWEHHAPRIWRLDTSVTLEALAQCGGGQTGAMPLLLPVGRTEGGEMWVNLQEVGIFGVSGEGEDADSVWRGMCQSLALSPFSEHVSFISTEEHGLFGRREVVVVDTERASEVARRLHREDSPVVILSRHRIIDDLPVVILHRQRPAPDEFGISKHYDRWLVHPTLASIEPHRCTDRDTEVLETLIAPESKRDAGSNPHMCRSVDGMSGIILHHRFITSVLGVPHVRHTSGTLVTFERNRSEELVIWLSLHPTSQRRSIARAEMWSVAIKDATFSNITSDVRRSLTLVESPPDESEWLGVTLTDDLPLHPLIVSDAHLLAQCFDHARRFPEDRGVEVLEYGLSLVRGVPFGGSTYLWRDTTGLGSEFSILAVRAALLLADMYAERGDWAGRSWTEDVYWATGQGLLAIPGHEDLVVRRMELHARNDDRAALCAEWQAYCRALASDDWGDVDPSDKMVEVWRRLTSRTEPVR